MPATVSHTTQFFPFGEEMAAQHAGGAFSTRYKFNGKELDPQTGYYYYGARYYDPVISRWLSIDPLAEKFTGLSPYNYTANNPVMLVDPDGRYFDRKNDKKAKKYQQKIQKRISNLERKMNRLKKHGRSVGDLNERINELKQSNRDINDMRNDKNREYRYSSYKSKIAKKHNIVGPTTIYGGTNKKGDDVILMFTEEKMSSILHESRHGGQVARNELNIKTGENYGVSDEISAYRAGYAWDGILNYIDIYKEPSAIEVINSLRDNSNPFTRTIKNISKINADVINSMADPGFKKLYPPANIPLELWNSN